MRDAAGVFARWRVRLGYLVALVVLWFSRPTPLSVLLGAIVGAAGLWIRAWAAGYLHKQEVLTVSGPYAYTRNPLYFGSAFLALGVAIATRSWISSAILAVYFVVVYGVVMRREEGELIGRHGEAFRTYAAKVPLFFPRLAPGHDPAPAVGKFSFTQYRKNHEYQAAAGYLLVLAVLLVIWRMRTA